MSSVRFCSESGAGFSMAMWKVLGRPLFLLIYKAIFFIVGQKCKSTAIM